MNAILERTLFYSFIVWFDFQIYTTKFRLFLFGIYVNVYLRGKQILYNEVAILLQEDENVRRFQVAEKNEISHYDDVCAICLGDMKSARKTLCKHLFHDHCLSLAVQASPYCPTCKAILWNKRVKDHEDNFKSFIYRKFWKRYNATYAFSLLKRNAFFVKSRNLLL